MCRLLAFAAARPTTAREELGPDQSARFQHMARLHQDGWGVMWLGESESGTVLRRQRVAETGHDSEVLAAALRGPNTRAAVFHLRLATDAMDIDARNTHPFLAGGTGLAHNGSIVPTGALRAMVDVAHLAGIEGDTDSELYFALLRQQLDDGLDPARALAMTVRRIRAAYPRASLNAIALSPETLVAVRASHEAPVPWDDFVASGLADHELPLDHSDAYFRMMFSRKEDGSIVFTSAGLETEGWMELPENTIASVDLATLDLSFLPVDSVAL